MGNEENTNRRDTAFKDTSKNYMNGIEKDTMDAFCSNGLGGLDKLRERYNPESPEFNFVDEVYGFAELLEKGAEVYDKTTMQRFQQWARERDNTGFLERSFKEVKSAPCSRIGMYVPQDARKEVFGRIVNKVYNNFYNSSEDNK